MSDGQIGQRRIGAFVVYAPTETRADGFVVYRPYSLAFAQDVAVAVAMNPDVPGCRAVAVQEAPTEDVLRVSVVACAGLLGNLVQLFAQLTQMQAAAMTARPPGRPH